MEFGKSVRSTEPIEFKLGAFLSKLGRRPVEGLRLSAEPTAQLRLHLPARRELVRRRVGLMGRRVSKAGAACRILGHWIRCEAARFA